MSDNLMDKVTSLGERLKIGGAEVGRKMSAGMSSMGFKMKELFQGSNPADKLAEDATSETLAEPNWSLNLDICDLINHEEVNSIDLIRAVKKRLMSKNPTVQYLSMVLLETCAKNCEKAFAEMAAERILDEMVKIIDDPQTVINNRNKALVLIEAWGESSNELRYLPVYEETYKSLKSRGVRFPGRDNESLAPIFTPPRSISEAEVNATRARQDIHPLTFSADQTKEELNVARNSIELLTTVLSSSPKQDALQDELTTTLVQQCQRSQAIVQRIIETEGDNEELLFEALNVNDDVQKALQKYEEMVQPGAAAMIPVVVEPEESPREGLTKKGSGAGSGSHGSNDEMMDDLDEMIFGLKGSASGSSPKKPGSSKDDLITF